MHTVAGAPVPPTDLHHDHSLPISKQRSLFSLNLINSKILDNLILEYDHRSHCYVRVQTTGNPRGGPDGELSTLVQFGAAGMDTKLTAAPQVCDQMLALKDNCMHPQTKKPYVRLARGGLENSPEGKQVSIFDPYIFLQSILLQVRPF
jgi:hypothetical protein